MDPIHIAIIGRNATDEDITNVMRTLKSLREMGKPIDIVCVLRGFEADPRELYDIPEARLLCGRLVETGFISYLSFAALLSPNKPHLRDVGYGAMEVWLCSADRMAREVEVTASMVRMAKAAYMRANAVSDALIGPMSEVPNG